MQITLNEGDQINVVIPADFDPQGMEITLPTGSSISLDALLKAYSDTRPQPKQVVTDDVYTLTIKKLKFSSRVAYYLPLSGVENIAQLCTKNREDILRMVGLGPKSCDEIEETLAKYGLTLRQEA